MLAWLAVAPLAASLAFGQAAPAKQLTDLRGSMEHWVLMARPDAADPAVRKLGEELTQLHERAVALDASDPGKVAALQKDFDDWKDRFAKVAYDRRPDAAPNDFKVYRKQLESGIGGLAGLHGEDSRASKQLGTLKRLVDPLSFEWYVEGSKDHSGAAGMPGWLAPKTPRGPASVASAGGQEVPQGWTPPSAQAGSDLDTEDPPDPALVKGAQTIGERTWRNGGTIGECYAGVKSVLEKLGVVSSFEGRNGRDGDGKLVRVNELTGAYQFNRWVENHPTLQKRKLLRVQEPAWPLEISDVVVWGRGVCGYNDDWGHIEMIYKLSPDKRRAWAVSDHSQEFNVDCFKREAARAVAARQSLESVRQAAAAAEVSDGALLKSRDRRAALRARKDLAAKHAALARAEDAADRVSVYKISREQKTIVASR